MPAQTAADLRTLVVRRAGAKRKVALLVEDAETARALEANGCTVLSDPESMDELGAFDPAVVVAFDGFARGGEEAFRELARAAPGAELVLSFAHAGAASGLVACLVGGPQVPALAEEDVRRWLVAAGYGISARDVVVVPHQPTGLSADTEAALRALLEQVNPSAAADRLLLVAFPEAVQAAPLDSRPSASARGERGAAAAPLDSRPSASARGERGAAAAPLDSRPSASARGERGAAAAPLDSRPSASARGERGAAAAPLDSRPSASARGERGGVGAVPLDAARADRSGPLFAFETTPADPAGVSVPALSVLISCGPDVGPLEGTVSALLRQPVRPLELVVASPHSADALEPVLGRARRAHGVTVLLRAVDGADASRRFNDAVAAATAPRLALLEAGDVVAPFHLTRLMEALDAGTSAWALAPVSRAGAAPAPRARFELARDLESAANGLAGWLFDRPRLGPFPLTLPEGSAAAPAVFLVRLAALFPPLWLGGAPGVDVAAPGQPLDTAALLEAFRARPLRVLTSLDAALHRDEPSLRSLVRERVSSASPAAAKALSTAEGLVARVRKAAVDARAQAKAELATGKEESKPVS